MVCGFIDTWWRHQMEAFPRHWPFVRGIHRSPVNSPHKGQWRGALMLYFVLHLNKRLSKQSWGWWFETPSRPLWRHCNIAKETWKMMSIYIYIAIYMYMYMCMHMYMCMYICLCVRRLKGYYDNDRLVVACPNNCPLSQKCTPRTGESFVTISEYRQWTFVAKDFRACTLLSYLGIVVFEVRIDNMAQTLMTIMSVPISSEVFLSKNLGIPVHKWYW